ncbi:MAG: zinc ribbon domain-containing protein [Eubacteriales bacterium]
MSKNFCTECGKALSFNANFCIGCGKKTHIGEMQLSTESKNICNNCGMPHSATAVFCKNCGLNINKQESLFYNRNVCAYCGMQQSATAVFCISCGSKLRESENNRESDEISVKKAEEDITIYELPSPSEVNKKSLITDISETLNKKEISPTTESTATISEVEPLNTVLNNNTNNTTDILNDPHPMTDIKYVRRLLKRPIIISLTVLVVLISVLTAYLNGWLSNPFNKQIPYDPEASVYAADMGDWQSSPDLKKEQDAIAKRQRELISSLEKDNIKKAVKYFYPEYQPTWQKQMEDDPEGTVALAAVLSTEEMTFLGKPNELKDDPRSRTATFAVKFEQSGFYITWIKYDGTWYLYDF